MAFNLVPPPFLSPGDLRVLNALHDACARGDRDSVIDLLDHGAPLLGVRMGHTPLTWAVKNGQAPVVQCLLERMGETADQAVHLVTDDRSAVAAVGQPATHRHQDVVVPRALEVALDPAEPRLPIVRLLLDAGADPDAVMGPTTSVPSLPLERCVAQGKTAALALLLEFNADPNRTTPSGSTALKSAAILGQPDPALLLLAHGANPNLLSGAEGRQGAALHALCENWRSANAGYLDTLKVLVMHGADPWLTNGQGRTAWDLAPPTALAWLTVCWGEQEKTILAEVIRERPVLRLDGPRGSAMGEALDTGPVQVRARL